MAQRTAHSSPFVTINAVNPGLCRTELTRTVEGSTKLIMKGMKAFMAWTAEEGARTLVYAVILGKESHGVFLTGGTMIKKYALPTLVL